MWNLGSFGTPPCILDGSPKGMRSKARYLRSVVVEIRTMSTTDCADCVAFLIDHIVLILGFWHAQTAKDSLMEARVWNLFTEKILCKTAKTLKRNTSLPYYILTVHTTYEHSRKCYKSFAYFMNVTWWCTRGSIWLVVSVDQEFGGSSSGHVSITAWIKVSNPSCTTNTSNPSNWRLIHHFTFI